MSVDRSALSTRDPFGSHRSRAMRVMTLGSVVAIGTLLVACGSTPATTASTATSTTTAAASGATPTTADSTGGTPGSTATVTVVKVSANTASAAEIQSALEAAGVTNAARWTREVMEYRPYAADDVNLAALKKELTKYNPSPETLAAILSALKP